MKTEKEYLEWLKTEAGLAFLARPRDLRFSIGYEKVFKEVMEKHYRRSNVL